MINAPFVQSGNFMILCICYMARMVPHTKAFIILISFPTLKDRDNEEVDTWTLSLYY